MDLSLTREDSRVQLCDVRKVSLQFCDSCDIEDMQVA